MSLGVLIRLLVSLVLQVSTWFANARRRLKKENKMTWEPRNKAESSHDDEPKREPQEEDAPAAAKDEHGFRDEGCAEKAALRSANAAAMAAEPQGKWTIIYTFFFTLQKNSHQ